MPHSDPQKYKEYQREWKRKYRLTDEGLKKNRMNNWQNNGVNNVNDELYKRYLDTENCEICGKDFTETKNKILDHDHETGEFRYVLCRECNNQDSWKYKIGLRKYVPKHNNRNNWNIYYVCECGTTIKKAAKSTHLKSKKHFNLLK